MADLDGQALAETIDSVIIVDIAGAGHGWFIDATPWDDVEFTSQSGGRLLTALPNTDAAGRVDLLTAVMHEMGHVLGLEHVDDSHDLMAATLAVSERKLPDASAFKTSLDASQSQASAVAHQQAADRVFAAFQPPSAMLADASPRAAQPGLAMLAAPEPGLRGLWLDLAAARRRRPESHQ
ncbi:MAG: matrixin family metalloprotease [Planctomycetia bacterium]|nr:matrixin family metalloprotease [Planctomycetia bacterium]